MSEKTVFLSYRRDAAGRFFARSIKEALTHEGYDVFLDVDCIDAGQWAKQILTQVPRRAHFLLLLTPGALDRCAEENDWVRKEFLAAVQAGRNIVPVREESVISADLKKSCPESMQGLFSYQMATVRHAGFAQDVETLIERYIPPHKAPGNTTGQASPGMAFRADISRIVEYAPAELIGRDEEKMLISEAWDKAVRGEKSRPHILTFVALGGEGKTSLVAKWAIDEMNAKGWPGCDSAFAWSFYSQGTREQMAASSDLFFKEALTFFGDPTMADGAQSAYEKGRRLAKRVGEQRALLILDGLEPLQYSPTSPAPGELKDQGLAALLKGLAAANPGLCVVTTRHEIRDLRAYWQTTAPQEKLSRLSTEAGVALLRSLGVKGTLQEFEKLVEDVKGHALTLNLLGTYLRDAHAGDVRKCDLVKLEEADAEEMGGHAFRVIEAYVRWFESEGDKGHRAIAVLRLLGLFDRPATAECLAALQKAPVISGMTKGLVGISEAQRNVTFVRLETAKLLTVNRDMAGTLVSLDAHPLLREYFARERRTQHLEAWRAAHRRLYEHLCASTPDKSQPTLEDLQPLYQAVAHGCQAGLQQQAFEKVYYARIIRGHEYYSVRKLGAFASDLEAAACFFETLWSRMSPVLKGANQAVLMNSTAGWLRALGRLTEAIEPMRAVTEMTARVGDFRRAAIYAGNLSELELTLGEVAGAVGGAEQSVTYADRSGDAFQRMSNRTTHADALHQAGRRAEAETRFREAEQMQAELQPDCPLLYSLSGFEYCDLLLTAPERAAWRLTLSLKSQLSPWHHGLLAKPRISTLNLSESCLAVSRRAAQTLKWEEGMRGAPLLDFALHHLTLGRAALNSAILDSSNSHLPTAISEVNVAVDGFRRASAQEFVVRVLVTRAWLRYFTGSTGSPQAGTEYFARAQEDLDEAWEIAERGPMRLFMADIHLYRARLFFRETHYPWDKNPDGSSRGPKDDLAAARKLIEQCGYWRRKEELEDAEAVILHSGT